MIIFVKKTELNKIIYKYFVILTLYPVLGTSIKKHEFFTHLLILFTHEDGHLVVETHVELFIQCFTLIMTYNKETYSIHWIGQDQFKKCSVIFRDTIRQQRLKKKQVH